MDQRLNNGLMKSCESRVQTQLQSESELTAHLQNHKRLVNETFSASKCSYSLHAGLEVSGDLNGVVEHLILEQWLLICCSNSLHWSEKA